MSKLFGGHIVKGDSPLEGRLERLECTRPGALALLPCPAAGRGGGAHSSSGVRCLNSRMFPGSPYWEVLLEMAIVCSCPPLARSGGRGLDPGLLSLLAAAGGQD